MPSIDEVDRSDLEGLSVEGSVSQHKSVVGLGIPPYYDAGDHSLELGKSFWPGDFRFPIAQNAISGESTSFPDDLGGSYRFSFRLLDEAETNAWDSQMNVRVSARYLGLRANTSLSNRSKLNVSQRTLTIAVQADAEFGIQSLDSPALSEAAKMAIEQNSSDDIVKRFGSHFVFSVLRGGRVTAFLTFEDISRRTLESVRRSASLKAGFGSFKGELSLSLSETLDQLIKRSSFAIDISTVGTKAPGQLITALGSATKARDGQQFFDALAGAVEPITSKSSKPLKFFVEKISEIFSSYPNMATWNDNKEDALRKLSYKHNSLSSDLGILVSFEQESAPHAKLLDLDRRPVVKLEGRDLSPKEAVEAYRDFQQKIELAHSELLTNDSLEILSIPSAPFIVHNTRGDLPLDVDITEAFDAMVSRPELRLWGRWSSARGPSISLADEELEILLSSHRSSRHDVMRRLFNGADGFSVYVGYLGTRTPLIWSESVWSDGRTAKSQLSFGAGEDSKVRFCGFSGGEYLRGYEDRFIDMLKTNKGDLSWSETVSFRDLGRREYSMDWLSADFSSDGRGRIDGSYTVSDRHLIARCEI